MRIIVLHIKLTAFDFSSRDLEVIKEQNASLQIHVLHLQEEINETQGKIRKVRDMIKLYGQVLQEMTARYSNIRKSEEPNPLSGRSLRTKEEEYDLLKVSHKTKYSTLKLNTKKKKCRNKSTMFVFNPRRNNN